MKRNLLVIVSLFFLTGIAFAQTSQKKVQRSPEQCAENMYMKLDASLSLTAKQQKKVKELCLDYAKELQEIRCENKNDLEERREDMLEEKREFREDMKEILTKEQFEIFKNMPCHQRKVNCHKVKRVHEHANCHDYKRHCANTGTKHVSVTTCKQRPCDSELKQIRED